MSRVLRPGGGADPREAVADGAGVAAQHRGRGPGGGHVGDVHVADDRRADHVPAPLVDQQHLGAGGVAAPAQHLHVAVGVPAHPGGGHPRLVGQAPSPRVVGDHDGGAGAVGGEQLGLAGPVVLDGPVVVEVVGLEAGEDRDLGRERVHPAHVQGDRGGLHDRGGGTALHHPAQQPVQVGGLRGGQRGAAGVRSDGGPDGGDQPAAGTGPVQHPGQQGARRRLPVAAGDRRQPQPLRGVAGQERAHRAEDGPHGGDDDHGDAEVGRQPVGPVGEHGGGPGGDRPRGVAVAVGPGAADAGEQAAGAHPAGVHHQLDDGRPGADQVGGGPGTGDHGVQGGPGEGEVGEQHGPLGGQG